MYRDARSGKPAALATLLFKAKAADGGEGEDEDEDEEGGEGEADLLEAREQCTQM
jgi:hypothetical protein